MRSAVAGRTSEIEGMFATTDNDLRIKSLVYRKKLLTYIKKANAGHTGGSLSCVDILNVLYSRILNVSPETFDDPGRDRYIHSKGHSVEALYVVLADRGFFSQSDLETLCRYRSHYVGHPTRKVHGIEHNIGALGHGLPASGRERDSVTEKENFPQEETEVSAESNRKTAALLSGLVKDVWRFEERASGEHPASMMPGEGRLLSGAQLCSSVV